MKKSFFIATFVSVLSFVFPTSSFAQGMVGGWNSMMNFGFTPFGGLNWIFMVLWWVLIIVGIVALVRWLASQSRGINNQTKSPLEILKERYARGEIDKEEFDERKKDLN